MESETGYLKITDFVALQENLPKKVLITPTYGTFMMSSSSYEGKYTLKQVTYTK